MVFWPLGPMNGAAALCMHANNAVMMENLPGPVGVMKEKMVKENHQNGKEWNVAGLVTLLECFWI